MIASIKAILTSLNPTPKEWVIVGMLVIIGISSVNTWIAVTDQNSTYEENAYNGGFNTLVRIQTEGHETVPEILDFIQKNSTNKTALQTAFAIDWAQDEYFRVFGQFAINVELALSS